MIWKIADAKKHLNELFTKAMTEGPQTITGPGQPVVVIAEAEYLAMKKKRRLLSEYSDGKQRPPGYTERE